MFFRKLAPDLPVSSKKVDEFFQAWATKTITFPDGNGTNILDIALSVQEESFVSVFKNTLDFLNNHPEEECWIDSSLEDIILRAKIVNSIIELEVSLYKHQMVWLKKYLKKNFPTIKITSEKITFYAEG